MFIACRIIPSDLDSQKLTDHYLGVAPDGGFYLVNKSERSFVSLFIGKIFHWISYHDERILRVREVFEKKIRAVQHAQHATPAEIANLYNNAKLFNDSVIQKHNETLFSNLFFWTKIKLIDFSDLHSKVLKEIGAIEELMKQDGSLSARYNALHQAQFRLLSIEDNPVLNDEVEALKNLLIKGQNNLRRTVQREIDQIESNDCTPVEKESTLKELRQLMEAKTQWVTNRNSRGKHLPFPMDFIRLDTILADQAPSTDLQAENDKLKQQLTEANTRKLELETKITDAVSTGQSAPSAPISVAVVGTDKAEEFHPDPVLQDKLTRQIDLLTTKIAQRLPPGQSYCFSPVSIAAVLGMIVQGLRKPEQNNFLKQIDLQIYHPDTVIKNLAQIINSLTCNSPHAKVKVSNAIAVLNPIKPEFSKAFENEWGSTFSVNDSAVRKVNSYIAQGTDGEIANILQPGSLHANTVCALINAFFFKAEWMQEFQSATQGEFTLANGSTVSTMMMSEKLNFEYKKVDNGFYIELPYKTAEGHRHKCCMLVPNDAKTLRRLLIQNPIDRWSTFKNLTPRAAKLVMPSFTIQYRFENLKNILGELGFPVNAALDNIAENTRIDSIISQAAIDVDKFGTKGAAATVATVSRSHEEEILVNRAFAYCVKDGEKILFHGTVEDKSVLLTQEQCNKNNEKREHPFSKTSYTDSQKLQFLTQDADWLELKKNVPSSEKKDPEIYEYRSSEVVFTIVNYSDYHLRPVRKINAKGNLGFVFQFNGVEFASAFTRDNCLVALCPGISADQVITYSKDFGESEIMQVEWNITNKEAKKIE